jgi:decaprenyl-phosphate phosphoribosyltransferase
MSSHSPDPPRSEPERVDGGTDGDAERPSRPSPITPEPAPPRSEGSLLWRATGILITLRPHQWVKNVFVLAPVAFAKEIFDGALLTRAAAAFVVFCLLASAVYTINDVADVEADRQHPVKRHRPIAARRVPVSAARVLAIGLVTLALGAAVLISGQFFLVAFGYFALNVAYSLKLKHVAYLDVLCIAIGFVLRVVAGGFATHIEVSNYLLACTVLLALFLGFGKRRHELSAAASRAGQQRIVLESYTARGLDVSLAVTALLTLTTYLAYTLDPHTQDFFRSEWLWVSTLFVVLGMLRFVHLVRSRPHAESPTQEMLRDGPFVLVVLVWGILMMWVVYNLRPS